MRRLVVVLALPFWLLASAARAASPDLPPLPPGGGPTPAAAPPAPPPPPPPPAADVAHAATSTPTPAPSSSPDVVVLQAPPLATHDAPVLDIPPPRTRHFYESGWFWGALGAAAVAGGILYLTTRDTGSPTIHLQVQVPH